MKLTQHCRFENIRNQKLKFNRKLFSPRTFPDGSSLYRAFLLREFSNENLEFWLAVEEYKNSKPQKMAAKAQQIYNDFVAVQASKEVRFFFNLIELS
jgi:type III secretory pathway component EscR